MKTNELSQDVQDTVKLDFTPQYCVADTCLFLERLLPVKKSTMDTILQHMTDEQIYDSQTQRWKGFPDPTCQESGTESMEAKENALYGLFCAIAEAISEFVEARGRPSGSEMGLSKWVDYHNSESAQLS